MLHGTLTWSCRPGHRCEALVVVVSVRSLAGLGVMSHAGPATGLFHLESSELRDIAGFLPTDCRLTAVAFASYLFLTSYPFGILTLKETPELNTGD